MLTDGLPHAGRRYREQGLALRAKFADRRGVRWRDADDHPSPPVRRSDWEDEPIGLLAGSGGSRSCSPRRRKQGLRVACVGSATRPEELRGTSAASFQLHGVARLGGFIRTFRRLGVKRVVMAGKVTKNVIYTPWRVIQLCPDFRIVRWWYDSKRADNRGRQPPARRHRRVQAGRADVRLGPRFLPGAAREEGGIDPAGTHARRAPGHRIRLEPGQGDGPPGRRPVGRRRAWPSRPSRGPIAASRACRPVLPGRRLALVKVAKPQQDMRFDVPTIGVTTIENLHKARARVLAIEADRDDPPRPGSGHRPGRSLRAEHRCAGDEAAPRRMPHARR